MGPFPVTIAWTKKPNLHIDMYEKMLNPAVSLLALRQHGKPGLGAHMENMAKRPFLSSLTLSSANVSGSSARPRGSK